jgi:excisionase family DNA binding protein
MRSRVKVEENPVLYSVLEAASKLHLPPKWFYERTRTNAIPHRRFGKHVRFSESDLEAIIKGAEVAVNTITTIGYNGSNGRNQKALPERSNAAGTDRS